MSEPAGAHSAHPPAPPGARPRPTRPCSTCGFGVDPLRASRVAIFAERFHYFCSPACRERFAPHSAGQQYLLRTPASAPNPELSEVSATPVEVDDPIPVVQDPALPPEATSDEPARASPLVPSWLHAAVLLGVLAALFTSPAASALPTWLAPSLAAGACAAWLAGGRRRARAAGSPDAALGLAAPLAATASALALLAVAPRHCALASSVAGIICAVSAGSLMLLERARLRLEPGRAHVARALSLPWPTTLSEGSAPAADLKPGEELVLKTGDRCPVDAVIVAGRARVEPWLGSEWRVLRQDGDSILAGAQVVEGALRAVVRWAGNDRAWARLSLDPARRADRHLSACRLAQRISGTGGPVLGLCAAALALTTGRHPLLAVSYAAAASAALANVALFELLGLSVRRAVYRMSARGISFRSPAALDRAGRTLTVVFCAEGSLLKGDFGVASIEPSGSTSTDELLRWLAGAYASVASPIGSALQRSAQAHKIRPDATRSPSYLPGLGVTAVTSTGQSLVVGARALLLERRISVASAETRIAELEALGRQVLLVALDGRWVGLIALQDSLQPGARAAVQRLLDARVESVLLSGDARETSRALARHMGIEHVRPEVLPDDRAQEVRRLSQAGVHVAVVGRSSTDDGALGAAQLSINIDASGGPLERWDIDIASGDVRDAAAAVALARELASTTRVALVTALVPVAVALLFVLLGAPAWILPLAGFAGSALAFRPSKSSGA
jgi:Cu+-exporting ATPase